MKKIALICIVVVFAACGSPEKTAQKLVKDYLKENLKDPSSYQSIEFGSLDTLYTSVAADTEYTDLVKEATENLQKALYSDHGSGWAIIGMKLKEKSDSIERNFVPTFKGWKMAHKYRAKNGFGALDLSTDIFCFNKELSKVIDVEEE